MNENSLGNIINNFFLYVKEKYDTYYHLYGETQFNFGNILHTVVGNLKTRRDLDEAITFLNTQNLGQL